MSDTNTDKRPIIGIDLGGTNMQVGVTPPHADWAGRPELLGRSRNKTRATDGAEAVLDRIAMTVDEALEAASLKRSDIAAVGIGAPGPIEPSTGVVLEAVNLKWNNLPLASLLSERLDNIPVVVDNDVNAAVWGEHVAGAGRGASDLLGVWVGTGVGGGLIFNNKLFYGHSLTAGEIGHMLTLPTNPPGHRSLEHNCSRTSVVERIVKLIRANRQSVVTELVEGNYDKIKSKVVAKAYDMHDELVREIVDNAADLLGAHIAGIVTLLSLPKIVLGGGLTEAIGEPYVSRVRSAVREHAFPDSLRSVEVVASELEDDAGLLGAAALAAARIAS